MLPLIFSVRAAPGYRSASAHQPLTQSVDQVTLALGQVIVEAIDRLDDDPPLRQAGDRAQRVQAGFQLKRNADAELWVIFYLFPVFRAGRWSADRTAVFHLRVVVVGHSRVSLPNN